MRRRVVLVDDHELFRAGVRGELGDAVEIVGEAGTVAEAVPLIRELDPESFCSTSISPTAAARA
jgi:DNA-binding NarL/FixJ family response regulator